MYYNDFERTVSVSRLNRYLAACGNDRKKAMVLYRANIRVSKEFLAVLSLFEVALRNAIDRHYKAALDVDWLRQAVLPGGYLTLPGCERSNDNVRELVNKFAGTYTHDKGIAELMFGFWTNSFNSREFSAAGSSLLAIFPNRPFGTSHTQIYHRLRSINKIRNRIAHHEPVCFRTASLTVSTIFVGHNYRFILELLYWMNINPSSLFYGIDKVEKEITTINNL